MNKCPVSENSALALIDVEDTVVCEGVDFVMAGKISSDGTYPSLSFIKTGAGTMRLDGVATLIAGAVAAEMETRWK